MTSIFSRLSSANLPAQGNDLMLIDQINANSPTGYTTRKISAGLLFANLAYAAPVSVKQYGAKGDGVTDDTAAIQAAINIIGIGGTIFFPAGVYKVTSTLFTLPGQNFLGVGWNTITNSFATNGGSVLMQFNTTNIATISVPGTSESNQYENVGFEKLAVVHTNVNNNVGQAITGNFARKLKVKDCYLASFDKLLWLQDQCWGFELDHSLLMNCNTGFEADSASEDGLVINSDISPFRSSSGATACIHLVNQTQNVTILSTGLHFVDSCLVMQQGDTNGNGTGTPFPMHAKVDGCYLEDANQTAVQISSSNGFASAKLHPTLSLTNSRVFNGGAYATPNNGQTIVYAEHAAQIYVNNIQESGFSYGGVFNHALYGRTVNGNDVGNVIWGQDDSYTYGTSRFLGSTKQISFLRGNHALCSLGTTATTIALSSSFGNPAWNTSLSDFWTWGSTSLNTITPSRNQRVRIICTIYVSATVSGARYALILGKNLSTFATLADITAMGTNPLMLQGEAFDIPNGTSDIYTIQIFCDSGSSVTITPANCVFTVELAGN